MKKNNLILMIVTISIFVALLVGATYAYFASNTNTGNGLDFSATLDDNNIAFTATSGTLSLHVAAENMLESQTGSGDVIAAESIGTENITISLSSNTEAPIACTYNVYFQWNNGQAYLTPTNASKNEFTLELELQDSDGTGSEGTNKFANETQLTRVITTANKTLVVENAYIVGSSLDSGSQTWVPTAKFYNLTDNQSALAGATFGGKFTIEDVECNAVASNSSGALEGSLAHAVLSKVSDNEYVSSQDQSKYVVRHETATGVASDAAYTRVTNYGTTKIYSASNDDATNGTDATGKFTKASDGTWTNNGTVTRTNYHIVLPIQENGYYEVCYTLGIGHTNNTLRAYVTDSADSTSVTSIYLGGEYTLAATANTPKSGCTYVGYLTTEKAIKIVNYTYASIASVAFYLQKTNEEETLDAGVRYEGKDPDNYVQFNGNEEWRIIGVFEGSTIGLEPGKQYTKIIRSTAKGFREWDECTNFDEDVWACVDGSAENDWANSTLNEYLNGEYLQSLTTANKIAQYNGNYSTWYLRGMHSETHAGENAYTPDWYLAERITGTPGYKNGVAGDADATTTGAIGLMYPSDYGYAAYGINCDNKTSMTLYNYENGCASVDWLLLENTWEWLISPRPDNAYSAFNVGGGIGAYGGDVFSGAVARPVLYLEADVMIASGSGTKADPYVLS